MQIRMDEKGRILFMATYVISDIHGEYEKFMELLEEIELKDTDTLYVGANDGMLPQRAREEGLIVPVIRDADKKTIVELAVEIQQIGDKARKNRLVPDDVSGGTFSLTNAGMFGATASTPIINQPQVAILGIHAIVKKPWALLQTFAEKMVGLLAMLSSGQRCASMKASWFVR